VAQPFVVAALWLGLALVATFLGSRLKISSALMEISVGIVAGAVATRYVGPEALGAKQPWQARLTCPAFFGPRQT
jgi:glutathione-regulated potassium-efflux system ancillary protein KefC